MINTQFNILEKKNQKETSRISKQKSENVFL